MVRGRGGRLCGRGWHSFVTHRLMQYGTRQRYRESALQGRTWPASCGLQSWRAAMEHLCRTRRIAEADIDLCGEPNGIGRRGATSEGWKAMEPRINSGRSEQGTPQKAVRIRLSQSGAMGGDRLRPLHFPHGACGTIATLTPRSHAQSRERPARPVELLSPLHPYPFRCRTRIRRSNGAVSARDGNSPTPHPSAQVMDAS